MTDRVESHCQTTPTHVVGIGASAGGLQALEEFFSHLPDETGAAYVIVQHLSPHFESMMDRLLTSHTKLPIQCASNGLQLEPDTIYLNSPRANIFLKNNHFVLEEHEADTYENFPIDRFFETLAHQCGPRGIAIVLSGAGSDGARSLSVLRERGSFILVQSTASAAFDSMPENAIATGLPHHILPPKKMGQRIAQYIDRVINPLKSVYCEGEEYVHSVEGGAIHPNFAWTDMIQRDVGQANGEESSAEKQELDQILLILQHRYHIDFHEYKTPTIARRIKRRMQLCGMHDLALYRKHLHSNAGELHDLFNDLLIGVTQFFRDPEAYQVLASSIIPELVERTPANGEIRIWSAGCATGEEVYSLAMLMDEAIQSQAKALTVKIFGSDIHASYIHQAIRGIYPDKSLAFVSEERQQRYFVAAHSGMQVCKSLRQMIIFSKHDLVRNPPFPHIDLMLCRNILIYLRLATQQKVLHNLYNSLKNEGFLMLGPSENLGNLSDAFNIVDSKWRIFQKSSQIVHSPFSLPSYSVGQLNRAEMSTRLNVPEKMPLVNQKWVEDLMVACLPSGLLINHKYEVLYVFGNANQYLTFPVGRTTPNVIDMVAGEFGIALRAAVHQAKLELQPVTLTQISTDDESVSSWVDMTVFPLLDPHESDPYFYVKLLAVNREQSTNNSTPNEHTDEVTARTPTQERPPSGAYAQELTLLKQALQATAEEKETVREELTAANEELQTINEELTSTNEELYSINVEYQRSIEELTQLNNDLHNMQRSTQLGVIFLDTELRIQSFTSAASQILHLMDHDIQRPLQDLSLNLSIEYADIELAAQNVLVGGQIEEVETQTPDGLTYLLRVLPYLSETSQIEGVILTFVNITEHKALETLRLDQVIQHYLNGMAGLFIVLNKQAEVIRINPKGLELLGYQEHEVIGKNWFKLTWPVDKHRAPLQEYEDLMRGGSGFVEEWEVELITKNGDVVWIWGKEILLHDEKGRINGLLASGYDVTVRKKAEQAIAELNVQRDALSSPVLVYVTDVARRKVLYMSPSIEHLLGFAPAEWSAKYASGESEQLIHPEDRNRFADYRKQRNRGDSEQVYSLELRIKHKKKGWIWLLIQEKSYRRDNSGDTTQIVGVGTDITRRKLAEIALQRRTAFIETIAATSPSIIYTLMPQEKKVSYLNQSLGKNLGYSAREIDAVGNQLLLELVHPEDLAAMEANWDSLSQNDANVVSSDEYRFRHRDGSWRCFLTRETVSQRDAGGKATEIVGAALDITEQKRTAKYLQLIADNLPARISYVDRHLRLRYANRLYEISLGLSQDEILGQPVSEVIGEERWRLSEPYVKEALAGKTVVFENQVTPFEDGTFAHEKIIFVPDLMGDEIQGYIVLVVDQTTPR